MNKNEGGRGVWSEGATRLAQLIMAGAPIHGRRITLCRGYRLEEWLYVEQCGTHKNF